MELGMALVEALEGNQDLTILIDSQPLAKAIKTHEINSHGINQISTTLNTHRGSRKFRV